MKGIGNYIFEKLSFKNGMNPESSWSDIERQARKLFEDEKTIKTFKFLLNFIRRSKREAFRDSIFRYWQMYIVKDKLVCMHPGWSNDGVGYRKSAYIEKVIDNYNKDNGTKITCSISGWSAESNDGVNIFNIKEIVDALKEKYPDFNPDPETELIEIGKI